VSSQSVRFGTDGWRAVIADGFTFPQVARVAQASARVLARTYAGEGIVIGYDHRFLSEHFAATAAQAVAALSIPVSLAAVASPTPSLSWAAKQRGAHGALVITASHNPPHYSGLKVKGGFGGSVPAEVSDCIEQDLVQGSFLEPRGDGGGISEFDPWPNYCHQLSQKVDLHKLRQSPAKVWVDVMHGSAAGGMTRLLADHVQELRSQRDPFFGGMAPEPLAPQLAQTMQILKTDPAPLKVGLVFDGDGDRIAAIDGQGNYLSSQILIPILIEHLAKRKGLRGEVVKTVSGSQLFAKVAQHYDLPLTETAVGFKYIAERMMTTQVLLGGEESGGIGYPDHMPERDAMLSALYLLEAVADTKQDLSDLYAQIQAEMGYVSTYRRRDLHLQDPQHQTRLLQHLAAQPPREILGCQVLQHFDRDGHKFSLSDGSWLMIRSSGTEPLLRLYSEATDLATVENLLSWAEAWAHTH
jgi:phosphomannomutase